MGEATVRHHRLITGSEQDARDSDVAPSPEPSRESGGRVPVWDVAVRLFHWSLVAAVLTSWFTGGSGNRIHEISGSAVAGLLAFRLVWGLIGTRHARFKEFVFHPRALFAYLKDVLLNRADRHVGHNPAGGAMIVALLLCLAVIVTTGFMQLTNRFYGVEWVEHVHHYAANGLMVLVPLHVFGVIISSWMHQENLVGAMLSGDKPMATSKHPTAVEAPGESERFNFRLLGSQGFSTLLFVLACGLATGWVLTSGRNSGVIEEAKSPAQIPAAIAPAIQEQAAARLKDRQDYTASGPDDASLTWVLASGGRLYDNIFTSLATNAPATNHPAWPASNTTIQGEATWRCKSCHGWDYQGRDGQYRTGPNATVAPGIQRSRGRDPAVLMAIMGDSTHQYTDEILPQHAKYRIAQFISRGLHDASRIMQSGNRAKGDVAQGKAVFQTVCAACHGFDGRARKLGISSDRWDTGYTGSPLYVGTKATTGPHEVLHKIRNGHPGVIMVSMRAFPMDVSGNLLAYLQTLPVK
jgi:cytochrome b/mono/diheme cytochrome c family protein